MNSYSNLKQSFEDLQVIALILLGLLILVVIRNWYNLYKKRSFRKKSKELLQELKTKETLIKKLNTVPKSNELKVLPLQQEIADLKKKRSLDLKEITSLKEKLNTTLKQIQKKEEDIQYQKKAYENYVDYKTVEANNTRLGAHFVKNVITQIYEDLEEVEASYKTIWGFQYKKEKEGKKLPSIEALKSIFKLLDYNVSALHKESIAIEDELKHVRMFLDLINYLKPNAKIALNNTLKENENTTIKIKPTLFFPFVENALKHGNLNEESSFISIDLKQTEQKQISYSLVNSIEGVANDAKNEASTSNFGLNALKQLIHTYYPGSTLECRVLPNKQYLSELTIKTN